MKLQLKENCAISLLTATSMGVRITPTVRQPVGMGDDLVLQATSAESNVLSISAGLGLRTKVLTAFVKGSPIAAYIKSDLRRRGIAYEGVEHEQGGPWGYRHQFNIADSGYGVRGPRVWNDRAGEVGREISAEDFDLERIFDVEGVQILHISGLFAALSEKSGDCCLRLAKKAHQSGTLVSFDLNYRASFWKGRETELREIFSSIASVSDILIGNEEDFQLALGIKGPEAGGKDVGNTDAFKEMIMNVRAQYPNVRVYANTLREVISSNCHLWGATMLCGDEWQSVEPREIAVLDRIGGGDGFVGGMLYAILRGWDSEKWIQFAWATGALVTTLVTDYALPADEAQVWSIWHGNARVQR